MSLNQALLAEFDNEMKNTRKTLERVPEDKFSWKPHTKSMELGRLSTHIAELPGWIQDTFQKDSFDLSSPGGQGHQPPQIATRRQLLELFDRNVASGRAALAAAKDEQFQQPWSLLRAGETIFTLPRGAVLRSMVLNHVIHHRAQLGVYLRLNDVPVPAIYGPSADESNF
ncbi:MAG TPA: DinB family protein [Candidatus Dormibacteraeota bacterium]|nr:DinB family protein [Candidatus Dormibacteraeota bacterium]